MAFNETELFTVIGKYVKAVDAMDVLLSTYGNTKTDLATILNSQAYLDYYAPIPATVGSIQDGVTSWINSLINDSKNIFVDKTKVLAELNFFNYSFLEALEEIHLFMDINNKSILESTITLGGTASMEKFEIAQNISGPTGHTCRVFVASRLSKNQAPGAGIASNPKYNNVDSELVIPTTVTAEVISDSALGSEALKLTATNKLEAPYRKDAESPGVGPTLSNAHGSSIISNEDFSSWTNDNPSGWTMAGGISGTDWVRVVGPPDYLQIKTNGVSMSRTVAGMTPGNMYFIGVYWEPVAASGNVELDVDLTMTPLNISEPNSITSVKNFATTDFYAFNFFSVPEDVTSDVTLTLTPTLGASEEAIIRKVLIVPAVYYNGCAWAAWSGAAYDTGPANAREDVFTIGDIGSIVLANDNAGKFQTFFRKAYGYQLPTKASPSIADSLAT